MTTGWHGDCMVFGGGGELAIWQETERSLRCHPASRRLDPASICNPPAEAGSSLLRARTQARSPLIRLQTEA
jgi:hypothetical protein